MVVAGLIALPKGLTAPYVYITFDFLYDIPPFCHEPFMVVNLIMNEDEDDDDDDDGSTY